MGQLEYNLLFRWLVGLNIDQPVWLPTVFQQVSRWAANRDTAEKFFAWALKPARFNDLLSDETFQRGVN